jgi:mono/diheme cytochrome c family protein
MGATGAVDDLRGGMMWGANWYAPSLLNDKETQLGSTPLLETMRLLQTGHNQHHWVTGPMKEVVQHSLQYLTPSDLRAMAVYLQTETQNHLPTKSTSVSTQNAQALAWQTSVSAESRNNGAKLYVQQCANCHGQYGEGLEDVYPALTRNKSVLMSNPTNLVQSVLYGGFSVSTSAQPRPYGMPPYVLVMSDADIADVLTHIRQRWGNQAPPVSELDVAKVRGASSKIR